MAALDGIKVLELARVAPAEMPGTTKVSRMAKLAPRPARAASPRSRPNATIAAANRATSQSNGMPRWCSAMW